MDTGAVRVGDVDVRAISTEVLMAQIVVFFQDACLLGGTIEENVRLGRPEADDAEVRPLPPPRGRTRASRAC